MLPPQRTCWSSLSKVGCPIWIRGIPSLTRRPIIEVRSNQFQPMPREFSSPNSWQTHREWRTNSRSSVPCGIRNRARTDIPTERSTCFPGRIPVAQWRCPISDVSSQNSSAAIVAIYRRILWCRETTSRMRLLEPGSFPPPRESSRQGVAMFQRRIGKSPICYLEAKIRVFV